VKSFLQKMNHLVSQKKSFSFHLVSKAQAETCSLPGQVLPEPLGEEMVDVTLMNSWEVLSQCLTGLGSGAWDSTGGAAIGLSTEFKKFLNNPSEYFEKTSNHVAQFLSQTKNFLSGLITDTQKTMEKLGNNLGEEWSQMSGAVAKMGLSMKIHFVCELIGSFGTDGFIAFFSGGAALNVIAPKLLLLSKKFSKIQNLFSKLSRFPNVPEDKIGKLMKKIFKVDNEEEMRLFEGVSSDDFDHHFARDLILCSLD
jgi:hypothetical protein